MRDNIDWFNLNSAQRDRLIHEKVMQVPILQENFPIPRYTTSMDDAWLVVEKMWNDIRFGDGGRREGRSQRIERYYKFDKRFLTSQLTGLSRERAANEICFWSLDAMGYEVIFPQEEHPLEPVTSSVAGRDYPDLEGE